MEQSCDQLQRGRLAAAAWPEQDEHLSLGDGRAQPADDSLALFAEALHHVDELEFQHAGDFRRSQLRIRTENVSAENPVTRGYRHGVDAEKDHRQRRDRSPGRRIVDVHDRSGNHRRR